VRIALRARRVGDRVPYRVNWLTRLTLAIAEIFPAPIRRKGGWIYPLGEGARKLAPRGTGAVVWVGLDGFKERVGDMAWIGGCRTGV
jgi:hypothetical protein